MSLILEALRRSEAERRRGLGPDIHAELPPAAAAARRTRAPLWTWLLPGAVVLALGLLWLVRQTAPAADGVATRTPVAAAAPAPRPATTRASLPAIARLEAPAPAPVPGPASAPPAAPVQVAVAEPTPPVAAPQAIAPPPAAALAAPMPPPPVSAPAAAPGAAGAIALADLAPDQRKALPTLKLSMHMWNDDPARRFVILDGQRLGEGGRIGEAVVTAIVPDGVILDWNGTRLRLPIR